MPVRNAAACLLTAVLALPGLCAQAAEADAFELDLFKTRFEHEIQFRAAAIHVAWGAEALCDTTTEIEPFVLWSTHALKKRLSAKEIDILRRATGMDDKWRVAWLDESAPDEMNLGDVVVAIDGKPLPAGSTRFEPSQLFRGGSIVASDDQGFWDVLLKAREQASENVPMTVTLEGGRTLTVATQTGCAGSVTASAFDADPNQFWRSGATRVKIPANALLEARNRDEFRWLAAFGTYFQASESVLSKVRDAEMASNGFVVGKLLLITVPGAGLLLTAAEAQAERALVVDSTVGSADLFANEVVTALGGDPAAGLHLSERLVAGGSAVDAVMMGEFRRSNAAEHAKRLLAMKAAQDKAQAEADLAEQRAQEEAQKKPLVIR